MNNSPYLHDGFMEDMKFYDPIRYNTLQMERQIINEQYGPNDWEKIWWSQRDIFQVTDQTRNVVIQFDLPIPKVKKESIPIPSYTATWLVSDLVPNPI